MISFLKKLFSWINPLDKILEELVGAYKKKLESTNYKDKLEAEVIIKTLELRRDVLINELKFSSTRWIRPALVFPFLVYDTKVLVYDYTFGLGSTPMLPEPWWTLHWIVYGFYFLGRPFEKIFRK